MRLIPKYQRGGGFDSFFTTYTPLQEPKQTRQSISSSKKSSKDDDDDNTKGKLTEKDFFSMLKGIDGLPNDLNQIVTDLISTFQLQNLTGIETSSLSTKYLQSLYQITVASQLKKELDDSVAESKKNGSYQELAITPDGNLLIQNQDGSINPISLDTYLANKEDYQKKVLTVAQLDSLRRFDPTLSFKKTIPSIINNSMGYEEFQDILDRAKISLGTTEYSETGLSGKNALMGLKTLQKMSKKDKENAINSALDGIYEYSMSDDNNTQQIQDLITYMNAVLPKRAKIWAALKLQIPDEDKAANILITQYLKGESKSKSSFTIDFKGTQEQFLNKGKGKGSSDNELNEIDINTPAKLIAGYGEQRTFVLNPGTSRSYQIISNSLPLTNNDDKSIGPNITLQTAMQGNFSRILDLTNTSMGGNMISPTAFKGIVLPDGRIHSIDYPIDIKAFNSTGSIIPDTSIKTVRNKQAADRELKGMGINVDDPSSVKQNYSTINKIYQKYDLPPAYSSNGEPTGSWRRFGVFNAIANNRILNMGDLEDNPLLSEITDDSVIDNVLEIMQDTDFDKNDSLIELGYDRMYQGTLWIPLIIDYHSALAGVKQSGGEAYELDKAQQIKNAISNYKSGRQPQ